MPYFENQGHSLFYRERGSGPMLLVLHGNTSSSAMHEGELEYFGRRFHAVAPDLLGCGQSERLAVWPEDWWERAADDAAALVARLDEKQAIVIGTSGGGVAALLMAIGHPDSVRAVIADSCVEKWTPGDVKAAVAGRSRPSPGQAAFWRKAHGSDWHAVVASDTDMFLRRARTPVNFYRDRLCRVKCPVLLSDSLADDMLPRVAEQVSNMARQIPDCSIYLSNEGRHPFMWSRAQEFRSLCDAFLSDAGLAQGA